MPQIKVNDITMNYEQQGSGEPLILIPFLAADNACFAFQVSEYAKHFNCIAIDLRGAGETDKPASEYSIELFADDVASLMQALGIERAHVSGYSLGAATCLWLGAKYPNKVKSLSAHGGWTKSDLYIKTVVHGWQELAKHLGSVTETVITGIFPWCFKPDVYAERPDYIDSLIGFVRSRPQQPVDAFLRQCDAAINHDVERQLAKITAPTQITFGRFDMITSTRFAARLTANIPNSELVIFEDCSHAPFYEDVEKFNQTTLDFLKRH